MRADVRKMAEVYHTEVAHGTNGILLKFFGKTKSKRVVQFHVDIGWDCLPYITPQIQKKWADERARRILKMNDIDRALPKPE